MERPSRTVFLFLLASTTTETQISAGRETPLGAGFSNQHQGGGTNLKIK